VASIARDDPSILARGVYITSRANKMTIIRNHFEIQLRLAHNKTSVK